MDLVEWIMTIFGGLTVGGVLAVARIMWAINKTIEAVGTDLKVFVAHAEVRFERNEKAIGEIKSAVDKNHESIESLRDRFRPNL